MPKPDLTLPVLPDDYFLLGFPIAKEDGYNRRKRGEMADKRGKTGGKSCFSDYGHGYRLGYCCSADEFHVKYKNFFLPLPSCATGTGGLAQRRQ